MLDVIRIDHSTQTIQPIDLKTGGEGFMKSYWKYKRYLQASMYTDAVVKAEWDGDINGYDVMPMMFIYADTSLKCNPLIYKSTPKDIHVGRAGIDYLEPFSVEDHNAAFGTFGNIKTKGYERLTAEFDWHIKNNIWSYDYDTYQKNGEVEISAFSVKL